MNMDAVKAEHVDKQLGNFSLQDVTFSVPHGSITGFIGRNGAGKTTTLRLLLGLSRPSSGSFSFFGLDRDATSPEIRKRLGVVLDGGSFFGDLRIVEMERIFSAGYPSWSNRRFAQLLDLFSLSSRQHINTLSRGMQAKLALALALSHDADLLVMDEPTAGLDPIVRREILDILKEFMLDGGSGVLFSTHITSDLESVADEIIMIDAGRVVFQEDRDSLLEDHRLVKGPASALTPNVRKYLRDLRSTPFGFSALTDTPAALKGLPGFVFERPSLEDVMSGYVSAG